MSIRDGDDWGIYGVTSLPAALAETLRLVRDAPPGVAESTLALLPCDERRVLAARGILHGPADAGAGAADIHITELGWHHISSA